MLGPVLRLPSFYQRASERFYWKKVWNFISLEKQWFLRRLELLLKLKSLFYFGQSYFFGGERIVSLFGSTYIERFFFSGRISESFMGFGTFTRRELFEGLLVLVLHSGFRLVLTLLLKALIMHFFQSYYFLKKEQWIVGRV